MPRGRDGLLWEDVNEENEMRDRALGNHQDLQWWVLKGRLEGDREGVVGTCSWSDSQCQEGEAAG